MKDIKYLRSLALLLIWICLFPFSVSAAPLTQTDYAVDSPHALLMDMNSGMVLYQKDMDTRIYPASTTKIMTAIVALSDKPDFDAVITVSETAVVSTPVGSSSMGLKPGEELTFRDLMYGMMVYSANDAANVLAEYNAGSIEAFVDKMNQKAEELGAKDTHFVTPHGFHDDDHYTTTRDMAIFARYAMTDPSIRDTFREIVATQTYTVEPTNLYPEQRIMNNTNMLLPNKQDKRYIYKDAIGIKTGHTSEAGYCLVSAANKNGEELLVVVMGSSIIDGLNMSYMDTLSLYGFAAREFQKETIVSAGDSLDEAPIANAFGSKYILLNAKEELSVMLPVGYDPELLTTKKSVTQNIHAPIKEGTELGSMEYFYDGESLGTVPLVADKTYHLNPLLFVLNGFIWIITSPWFFIPVLVIVFIVAYGRYHRKRRIQKQRMAKRKAMQEERTKKDEESQREFEKTFQWDDLKK